MSSILKAGRLHSIRDLEDHGLVDSGNNLSKENLEAVAEKYAIGITGSVLETIGPSANDPVRLQYVPQEKELIDTPDELNDPIGDDAHSPVPGIVHRYPDRVLLKAASACAVYCRYCFRRGMLGPGAKALSAEDMNNALDYIRSHKDIWEVILTGGDPLILSARKLSKLLDELCAIDHVKVIRIHSRVPVADPGRITASVLKALDRNKPIYLVVHINHENEISPEVEKTFAALRTAGCTLLSQSVLLKGVNDDATTLEKLFRRLITLKVKPYYLHHPDLAPGTSHFRLSVSRGQEIMRALRGRVSGICLPEYMLDIPGGHGKVPLTPNYLHGICESTYEIEDYRGNKHHYSK